MPAARLLKVDSKRLDFRVQEPAEQTGLIHGRNSEYGQHVSVLTYSSFSRCYFYSRQFAPPNLAGALGFSAAQLRTRLGGIARARARTPGNPHQV